MEDKKQKGIFLVVYVHEVVVDRNCSNRALHYQGENVIDIRALRLL